MKRGGIERTEAGPGAIPLCVRVTVAPRGVGWGGVEEGPLSALQSGEVTVAGVTGCWQERCTQGRISG